MTLRYIALALLINIVVSAPGCDDAVSFDQCEHLDCNAFPDLAVQFCPDTCQVCHKVNDTSSNTSNGENAGCQDSMSFAQCHLLDCGKFPDLAQQYCQRTCGVCPTCTDNADCLTFGPSICTVYPELAKKACPAYCNLCDSLAGRGKRFLEDPKPTIEIITNNRDCVDTGDPDLCKYVDCEKFPDEASHLCPKTCGYCRLCDDVSPNCAKFGPNICTSLREWSAFNCAKYCNFCQECKDHSDCSRYNNTLCEKYPELGRTECSRTCHFCEAFFVPSEFLNMSYAISMVNKTTTTSTKTTSTTTTRPPTTPTTTTTTTTTTSTTITQPMTTTTRLCDDVSPNCAKFGPNICTSLREWSAFNCAKYCNFCQECKDHSDCSMYVDDLCEKFPELAQVECRRTCHFCEAYFVPNEFLNMSYAISMVNKTTPTLTTTTTSTTTTMQPLTTPTTTTTITQPTTTTTNSLAGRRKRFLEDPKPTIEIITNNRDCVDTGDPDLCKFVDCEKFPDEASHLCQKTCGYCQLCDDVSPNCAKFGPNICTSLREWSAFNCAKYCNFCQECKDHSDCSLYVNGLCEKYPELGQTECSRTCHFCEAFFVPSEFLNMSYATSIANKTTPTPTTTTTTTTTTMRPLTTPTPTTSTTTTTQPTTTTPKLLSHSCNKFGLIHDVAERVIVTNPSAGKCQAASGTHSRSEAVIMEHCLAPNVTEWRQGEKVVDNCDRIPRYTPVATFTFGRYVMSDNYMSAVFIECEPGGFKMIAQFCGHPPMIVHVKLNGPTNIENANHYSLINW